MKSIFFSNAEKKIVDLKVLFLRRAHSPGRPPLDSNPLPTDYETRALTNASPGTIHDLTFLHSFTNTGAKLAVFSDIIF